MNRIRQGFSALSPAQASQECEAVLAASLTPMQAGAFRNLRPFDQAHSLAVHARLIAADVTDADLLTAGLLHDIGKADQHGAVRLTDRVLQVVLRRLAPSILTRLEETSRPGFAHGLRLCVHHPQLGAQRAAALGCNERTVWLIANHASTSVPRDHDLDLLKTADRG